MASQWYCQVLGVELGPLSFTEMAEMVRAGTLGADDAVRREGERKWGRACDVIGLFRAAARLDRERGVQQRSGTPPAAADAGAASPRRDDDQPNNVADTRRSGRASGNQVGYGIVLSLVGAIAALALLAWAGWYWHREATRFPPPTALRALAPEGHFFFGWGPFTLVECVLLWFDVLFVAAFAVFVAARHARSARKG